jgi:hypothetical protein
VSAPETLEQIAERIARETLSHRSTIWIRAEILAALREAEKCGEQRAAKLGGTLLDSAVERAEKAEAENARLKAAVEYLLEEHGGSVNIRHIKEAPGYTTVVYCPWCGDEEPCRVVRRVAEILTTLREVEAREGERCLAIIARSGERTEAADAERDEAVKRAEKAEVENNVLRAK